MGGSDDSPTVVPGAKSDDAAHDDKAAADQKPATGTDESKEEKPDIVGALKEQIEIMSGKVAGALEKGYYRLATDTQFTTLEDFERMHPHDKRMVVIGCTGAGKSTLLNKLMGNKYMMDENYHLHWTHEPVFESASGTDSVTKLTSFARVGWFGDQSKQLIIVDTPGHDDPAAADITEKKAQEKLGELAADLHNKLKAMGRIDLILVIHNDPHSNRLNPATMTILQMVDQKFHRANENVWDAVVMAYSKCDSESKGWRANMDPWCPKGRVSKQKEMQKQIRDAFPETCETDIPILCLSGVTDDKDDKFEQDEFARLHDALMSSKGVDTTELQPFEGPDQVYAKLVQEKDRQQALIDAMEAQNTVVLSFFALFGFVMWRALFVPSLLSIFVLDLPGPLDDALLFVGLAQFMGFTKVKLSMKLFYDKWLKAHIKSAMEQVGMTKEKAE